MLGPASSMTLQTVLASSYSNASYPFVLPHPPITCAGELEFYEDGSFACEHGKVAPDDPRTQACLDHTVAILLLEIAFNTL